MESFLSSFSTFFTPTSSTGTGPCSGLSPWNPRELWNRYILCNSIPPCDQIVDNDKVRIGIDFDLGGSIGYMATPHDPWLNYINSFDQGREIQMSFYAAPIPYNPPTDEYPDGACDDLFRGPWSWNPIGAGDVDGGTSEVLEFYPSKTLGNNSLRVVTRPLQWACHNVPCECTFDKTIETVGDFPAVKVINTLRNARTDVYDETALFDQELPAVYTNGILYRLVTYNGSKPFTNGEPVNYYEAGFDNDRPFPWIPGRFPATEHWAAFVNEENWGLGVINLQESVFLGGFSGGAKGTGGPKDGQTGYIAPVSRHALPRNVVFTYEYYLILGFVEEIRAFATQLHNTRRQSSEKDSNTAATISEAFSRPVSPWLRPKFLTILNDRRRRTRGLGRKMGE
ncbi:expressed unknown protein [Seminavis robusta]|uniref:Uncharacterized protein n=1 Tax=Seminavis robusta TaxID=568900 RepID=A0A9N8HKL5_9STRA|nr:expressed unknown protein [Seminavis robusta]|eukprot:Sro849_g210560.1 n/a (396) ;mRNA; r:27786-28973